MVKFMIFLKKGSDSDIYDKFMNDTLPLIKNLKIEPPNISSIESSLLMENKYTHLIEIPFASKDLMDEKMSTPEGKLLQRSLMNMQYNIDMLVVKGEK
jgi:hypothetical protein